MVKTKKSKSVRVLLPKLRKISYKNRKHTYKLKYSAKKRHLAIDEGVSMEKKKTGRTTRKAAIAKKGRFNILRIYRKNKKPEECEKLTRDMKYMDKKYKLGKTKNICKKSKGKIKSKNKTLKKKSSIKDKTKNKKGGVANIYEYYIKNSEIYRQQFLTENKFKQLEGKLLTDTLNSYVEIMKENEDYDWFIVNIIYKPEPGFTTLAEIDGSLLNEKLRDLDLEGIPYKVYGDLPQ